MPAGTYEDLTIEYGLIDTATGGYGYYKQTFKNKTLVAGENRVLSRDIKLDTESIQTNITHGTLCKTNIIGRAQLTNCVLEEICQASQLVTQHRQPTHASKTKYLEVLPQR